MKLKHGSLCSKILPRSLALLATAGLGSGVPSIGRSLLAAALLTTDDDGIAFIGALVSIYLNKILVIATSRRGAWSYAVKRAVGLGAYEELTRCTEFRWTAALKIAGFLGAVTSRFKCQHLCIVGALGVTRLTFVRTGILEEVREAAQFAKRGAGEGRELVAPLLGALKEDAAVGLILCLDHTGGAWVSFRVDGAGTVGWWGWVDMIAHIIEALAMLVKILLADHGVVCTIRDTVAVDGVDLNAFILGDALGPATFAFGLGDGIFVIVAHDGGMEWAGFSERERPVAGGAGGLIGGGRSIDDAKILLDSCLHGLDVLD